MERPTKRRKLNGEDFSSATSAKVKPKAASSNKATETSSYEPHDWVSGGPGPRNITLLEPDNLEANRKVSTAQSKATQRLYSKDSDVSKIQPAVLDLEALFSDLTYFLGILGRSRVNLYVEIFRFTNLCVSWGDAGTVRQKDSEAIGNKHRQLDDGKAPLSDVAAMFDFMVEELGPKHFRNAFAKLNGSKLQVVTMCSGTEAPIIAMQLFKEAFERIGINEFDFNHVASAEIEPFKAAFIQRNFNPPIIYRDVTEFVDLELGKTRVHTVYGAKKEAVEKIHVLIAGSSCVDYSTLNKDPKAFNEKGESFATLNGIMEFCKKTKPNIVILENVKGAPWKEIRKAWKLIGYMGIVVQVDTKNYCLPQTRLRGFMFAINIAAAEANSVDVTAMLKSWLALMTQLQRRASSPFTDFILSIGSPEYENAKKRIESSVTPPSRNQPWNKCKNRHMMERNTRQLGRGRHYSNWGPNGYSLPPDYSWHTWFRHQRERVLDTLDISLLRYIAKREYDMNYKSRHLDLSQNVDREVDNKAWGIIGCITPAGMPFSTLRGGPITGIESLVLQGIPVQNFILNKETSKQIQDLAGNAMSTTVVGAAIAAAIVAGGGFVVEADKDEKGQTTTGYRKKQSNATIFSDYSQDDDVKNRDKKCADERSIFLAPSIDDFPSRWKDLDMLGVSYHVENRKSVNEVKAHAGSSRRLCECELYSGLSRGPFSICKDCDHTVCKSCKGNPAHNYLELKMNRRSSPVDFVSMIEAALPRSFDICPGAINALVENLDTFVSNDGLNLRYQDHLRRALSEPFRYLGCKRDSRWIIEFASPYARLELRLSTSVSKLGIKDPTASAENVDECCWFLYALCDKTELAKSKLRAVFAYPIATMKPNGELWNGNWQIWMPPQIFDNAEEILNKAPAKAAKKSLKKLAVSQARVRVIGRGAKTKLWQGKLGIQISELKHLERFTSLELVFENSVPTELRGHLNTKTTFNLLQGCDAAENTLHKSLEFGLDGRPLYLFLDPDPLKNADQDSFVIAYDHSRCVDGRPRQILLQFPKAWRPIVEDGKLDETVICTIFDEWKEAPMMSMRPSDLRKETSVWHNLSFSPSTLGPRQTRQQPACSSLAVQLMGIKLPVRAGTLPEPASEAPTTLTPSAAYQAASTPALPPVTPAADFFPLGSCHPTLRAGKSYEIDLTGPTGLLKDFEWFLAGVCIPAGTEEWQKLAIQDFVRLHCIDDSPAIPLLAWLWRWANARGGNKRFIRPFEDPIACAEFEEAYKCRPSTATATLHCYAREAFLEVNLNVTALAHACLASLFDHASVDRFEPTIEWRLSDYNAFEVLKQISNSAKLADTSTELPWPILDQYNSTLPLTDADCDALGLELPNSFKRKLWLRQRQVLTWMLKQEEHPIEWKERESLDAVITALRKRLEVRAACQKEVKGGILADEVGSGKTTTALALFASRLNDPARDFTDPDLEFENGRIVSRATLILVPKNILSQWVDEIKKCFTNHKKVLIKIEKIEDLYQYSFQELTAEKIILAPWDLFDDRAYWRALRRLCCAPNVPFSGGRALEQWTKQSLQTLSDMAKSFALDPDPEKATWRVRDGKKQELDNYNPFEAFRTRKEAKKVNGKGAQIDIVKDFDQDKDTRTDLPKNNLLKQCVFETPEDGPKCKLDVDFKDEVDAWPVGRPQFYPILHAFQFERIIVDEFDYLQQLSFHALITLRCLKRWLMSGTPPTSSFDGRNTMARLLGTKLSSDAARAELLGAGLKASKIVFEQSWVEEYLGHNKMDSATKISGQRELSNEFVQSFVRQNGVNVQGTTKMEHFHVVKPTALEYLTYFEFYLSVACQTHKFGQKGGSRGLEGVSRTQRIQMGIDRSENAEEVLVSCTSHMLHHNNLSDNPANAASAIVKTKEEEFKRLLDEMEVKLQEAVWYHIQHDECKKDQKKKKKKKNENDHLPQYARSMVENHYGEMALSRILEHLLYKAAQDPKKPEDLMVNAEVKADTKPNSKKKTKYLVEEVATPAVRKREMEARVKDLTARTGQLQTLMKTLRFFHNVTVAMGSGSLECPECALGRGEGVETILSAVCGHVRCSSCLGRLKGDLDRNAECSPEICGSIVGDHIMVPTSRFQAPETVPHTKAGSRMNAVVAEINKIVKQEEYVLIFVQFDTMRDHLVHALKEAEVKYEDASQGVRAKSVNDFLNGAKIAGEEDGYKSLTVPSKYKKGNPHVLILKLDTADAAGWNLQLVSHVMFIAPFLAPSQHAYDAVMKQAIGRSLRFGQKAKYVHVHYFVTAHTVEVNILEDRRKMILRASGEGSDGTGKVIKGKEVNNGKRTETEEHPFAGPKLLVMTEEEEEIDEEQDENDDDDDGDDDDDDDGDD